MTEPPLVRDLLDLPEHTEKGDFVVKLTDGLAKAERTVRDYVVTPSIHESFDRALSVIGQCVGDGSSRAAYLHGSFGSGKSHFMAVLGLLLDGHPAAWGHRKLQDLRPKYPWIGEKKLLRVPVHMLGQPSLRDAVFEIYVETIAREHPDAPVPPLFIDEGLFEDADRLRAKIGDDAFFRGLNEGITGGASEGAWGDLAGSSTWDGARFRAALGSSDHEERAELVDRLTATFFQNWAKTGSRYLDFDRGLAAITRHARSLGYDGIILLLDELILWLAGRISNRTLVTQEVEHTVKLVEAQHGDRAVPIVSFIARQRSLKDLVGERSLGEDTIHLEEQLSHNQGRFSVIHLEERNLPEIVSQRLLRPKDDAAKAEIDRAFSRVVDQVRRDWQTLLGGHGDQDSFRKLYPFSPALIDALVAISDCLQRERTALKMLADMLVDHLGDLRLGQLVPVGDLFDLVAAGDPIDEPSLRHKFERAKEIYQQKILPILWRTHETGTPEQCQRLRDDHRVSLGCAMCGQVACRTSNRLMKTLLLADMVPNLDAFRDLTVTRVVGLNHGVIHSPIPGQEASIASKKLREWAPHVPELRVGDEADPTVRVSLDAVDIEPILQKAAQVDNDGARRRVLKDILFTALGLEGARDDDVVREIVWRGTKRRCRVLYGNVREMGSRHFLAGETDDARLVLDYPFDQGHSPEEDIAIVEKFVDDHAAGTATVVWLPSFFSTQTLGMLGRLVRLQHVQRNPQQYLAHMRAEDQERSKHAIDSLARQTQSTIRHVLEKAYGLTTATDNDRDLDPSRRLDRHFWCLLPDREIRGLVQTDFARALEDLADKLLHFQHPKHPDLGKREATSSKLEKVRAALAELREAPQQTVLLQNHPARNELSDIGVPLGLVEPTRSGVRLGTSRIDELERARRQENLETPTVGQMRKLVDPDGQIGLPPNVQDLLILAWAEQHDREVRSIGQTLFASIGNLENGQELCAQELPSRQQWQRALELGKACFGYARGKQLLSAANVREFVEELRQRGKRHEKDVEAVPELLRQRLTQLAAEARSPRLTAAQEAAQTLAIVREGDPVDAVRGLADAPIDTSPTAIGAAIGGADAQRRALGNDIHFSLIQKACDASLDFREKAHAALRADEVSVRLESAIAGLADEAMRVIEPTKPTPPPRSPSGEPGWKTVIEASAASPTDARALLERAGNELDAGGELELKLTLRRREDGPR